MDIQVKLNNMELVLKIVEEYYCIFDVEVVDIQIVNVQFEIGFFICSFIFYVVGIILLIVVGFGIYNILNMMIYEKMDMIVILKVIGFFGKDVKYIFIIIVFVIGIFGGIFGLIFGYLIFLGID